MAVLLITNAGPVHAQKGLLQPVGHVIGLCGQPRQESGQRLFPAAHQQHEGFFLTLVPAPDQFRVGLSHSEIRVSSFCLTYASEESTNPIMRMAYSFQFARRSISKYRCDACYKELGMVNGVSTSSKLLRLQWDEALPGMAYGTFIALASQFAAKQHAKPVGSNWLRFEHLFGLRALSRLSACRVPGSRRLRRSVVRQGFRRSKIGHQVPILRKPQGRPGIAHVAKNRPVGTRKHHSSSSRLVLSELPVHRHGAGGRGARRFAAPILTEGRQAA